jgi:branched-chain amino acid transport system permease protein
LGRSLRLAALPVCGVAAALAPLVLAGYRLVFLLLLFLHVGLAYSWNLVSGFTGYISFGHVAFFGVGAYVVGILAGLHNWNWLIALPLAGAIVLVLSVPLGWLMLRLKGPYFAIGMLAVAQATALVATLWDGLTRGGLGIFVSTSYNVVSVYYGLLIVLAVVMGVTYWVDNSRFGLRLLSIREDESAAEAMGIDTTRDKIKAFAMSAFFPGLIGGMYAWYIGYIDPRSVFSLFFSVNMILMTLLGGAGTFLGPLIGGIAFTFVVESLWVRFPEYHLMSTGIAVVMIVLFIPNGIVALLKRRGWLTHRRRITTRLVHSVEEDSREQQEAKQAEHVSAG